MKIAKKVLAVVMAVAMIACLSAMAFAADSKVTLKAGEVTDGKFRVEVIAKDYADLAEANWEVTYDAAVLNCTAAKAGSGVTEFILDSALITAFNANEDGKVLAGYAFEGTLGKSDELVLFYMDFVVEDANATNVTIALTGADEASVKVVLKEEETTAAPETTTAKVEETTKPAEETTAKVEETTKAPEATTAKAETTTNKTEGKPTGDTGVLAIAAGVVALAGAAFVVTKKRK